MWLASRVASVRGTPTNMPAKSARQQRFMGAELKRARQGKKTKTGMGKKTLKKMAKKPKGGYR